MCFADYALNWLPDDDNQAAKAGWIRVCDSSQLLERGVGVRFEWHGAAQSKPLPAFVIRHAGIPQAYVNQCRHVPVELDFPAGQFFDESGAYLVCATHGAIYSAENGRCQGGPCASRGLRKLECLDEDASIWVRQETHGAS
jgi:nitrite reductase/ring-hydroxylating ferredoxin subunit